MRRIYIIEYTSILRHCPCRRQFRSFDDAVRFCDDLGAMGVSYSACCQTTVALN